jgi:osmotically-inducible protein OsmY
MTHFLLPLTALISSLLLLTGCGSKAVHARKQTISFHSTSTASNPMYQTDVSGVDTQRSRTYAPPRSRARPRDNQQLAHTVLGALLSDGSLNNSHIQVASYHGDLLVVGEVQNQANITQAQSILRETQGVKSVALELKPTKNNSVSQQAQDSRTTTKVRKKLQTLGITFSHLQVITNGGKVYLMGSVSAEEKQQITHALYQIQEVQSVQFFR